MFFKESFDFLKIRMNRKLNKKELNFDLYRDETENTLKSIAVLCKQIAEMNLQSSKLLSELIKTVNIINLSTLKQSEIDVNEKHVTIQNEVVEPIKKSQTKEDTAVRKKSKIPIKKYSTVSKLLQN